MKTKTIHWASITAGILSLAGYASAANLGSEKYTYDTSGNIVEKSIDGQVTQMTYDPSNRITERQATGQSKETTAYDAAGRPIAIKGCTGQATRSMSYGYGDKVLETKSHGIKIGFYYNSEGHLVGKKGAGAVSTYSWDGNVLAADGTATFTNENHISGGIPLLEEGNNVLVSDYLGSTLSNGGQQFLSTAYGEGVEKGRLTGKPFVKELGVYVFLHRNYCPETNQWTMADPSGYPEGANNYSFVNCDPLSSVDPLGLVSTPVNTDYAVTMNNGSLQQTSTLKVESAYSVAPKITSSTTPSNSTANGRTTSYSVYQYYPMLTQTGTRTTGNDANGAWSRHPSTIAHASFKQTVTTDNTGIVYSTATYIGQLQKATEKAYEN